MKCLVFVAILAVAAAQEYHREDNEGSFHFTTLKDQVALGGLRQRTQTIQTIQKPVLIQSIQQQPAVQIVKTVQQPAIQIVKTVQQPAIQLQSVPSSLLISRGSLSSGSLSSGILSSGSLSSSSSSGLLRQSASLNGLNAPQWRILEQIQEVDPSGPYRANFKTENGIQVAEQGALTAAGPEGPAVASQGSYSWTSPEGIAFTVNWIADESGFRAAGDHLPTPPPIPEEILRSLEENARDGTQFDEQGFPLRQ